MAVIRFLNEDQHLVGLEINEVLVLYVFVVGHSGGSSGSGSLRNSGVQSGWFKHSDSPVSQWPADI